MNAISMMGLKLFQKILDIKTYYDPDSNHTPWDGVPSIRTTSDADEPDVRYFSETLILSYCKSFIKIAKQKDCQLK